MEGMGLDGREEGRRKSPGTYISTLGGRVMERDEPWSKEAEDFLRYLDRLRKFALFSSRSILGRNLEAEEVGEKALHALILTWLRVHYPAHPFGWLKKVVRRLCGKGRTAFHARLARLDGDECRIEDLPALDQEEGDPSEWERTEAERAIFLREIFPLLTPDQKKAYLALRQESGVKPAARALGKKPGNLRKTLRAIRKKSQNFPRNVTPHLRVEGKEEREPENREVKAEKGGRKMEGFFRESCFRGGSLQ